MSQAGLIDIESSNPQIPTQFNTDDNPAIPINNILEVIGGAGIQTSGSGNTVTISLTGGGAGIDEINVDASTAPGTDPVLPTGLGAITVTGNQVASSTVGSNVIRTNSLAANTYTIEVQQSGSAAAQNTSLNGVSHFNSSHFSVSNGFVSLAGGGQGIDSFTTDLSGPVFPDGSGNVAFTGATNVFSDGSGANTMSLNLQGTNHALFVGRGTNIASASLGVGTDGQVLIAATGADPAFATVGTNANMNTATGANSLTLNPYNCAKWIVDSTANIGTHTTIASALTSASSGETIFIRPGTYTENLTLKAGVNLTAFGGDGLTPNVTIVGKLSFSGAGTVSISGIRLQTNSDNFLAVTGASASIVNFINCYLNCSNNTGISYTTASASSLVQCYSCYGDITTTGIGLYSSSSTGTLRFFNCDFNNSGASTTASSNSAGIVAFRNTRIKSPISTTGTGALVFDNSAIDCSGQNTTSLTHGGSGTSSSSNSLYNSGTASAISIGAGASLPMTCCVIGSSNTNAITGAGSISYTLLGFNSTSSNINTTTQTLFSTGPSLTVGSSNTGNTNTLTVSNSSNTASSSANIVSSVGGGTAADPTHQSTVSGVTTWTWGIDNSVTSPTVDPWVLAQGTALGTNNVMSVATSGEINYPLQPAFLAVNPVQSNVTGDGTVFTTTFTTEIFDQNGDFDGTSTFTAPVTGKYFIGAVIQCGPCTASHTTGFVNLVTSNRNYTLNNVNYANLRNSGNAVQLTGSVLADMDAADTATVTLVISNGTKTVGMAASVSYFYANLVC